MPKIFCYKEKKNILLSALHVSVPVYFSQMITSFLHEVQSVILGIISAVVPGSESFCFFMLLLALHVCRH